MRTVPETIATRLDAAAKLLAERGFDATRVEDVAVATGVAKTTLYCYSDGKQEVLYWLLRRVLAALEVAVEDGATGGGKARARLERVVQAQLGDTAARPDAYRAGRAGLGEGPGTKSQPPWPPPFTSR